MLEGKALFVSNASRGIISEKKGGITEEEVFLLGLADTYS